MEKTNPQVHSYIALRRTVGWIGILLPFVLMAGNRIFFSGRFPMPNVSMYYFTGMHDVFVGSLCAIALFMFFYKGYDKLDNLAGNLAGFFALGIAFFPTSPGGLDTWTSKVHFMCAGVFFLILAVFSLFLFTRKSPDPTREKQARNRIYFICGSVMIISLIAILVFSAFFEEDHRQSTFVFWAETCALLAFGISWLTKGGALYPDK